MLEGMATPVTRFPMVVLSDAWIQRRVEPWIPVSAVQLADELYAIDAWMEEGPERLSCYLFDTPEGCLSRWAFGHSAPSDRVLDELGIDDIATIVVTHIHIDHAGGAGQLARRYPDARIGVHSSGVRHLVSPERLWASAAESLGRSGSAVWGPMEPIAEERLVVLDEGDRVPLGVGVSSTLCIRRDTPATILSFTMTTRGACLSETRLACVTRMATSCNP